jgi:hypothetical protein
MMEKFVCITGSNATGKSTRVNAYVDSLKDYVEVEYKFLRKVKKDPEGTWTTLNVGRRYGDVLILGKKGRNGMWVGVDYVFGRMGNKAAMFEFLNWCEEQGVKTIIAEGYYAIDGSMWEGESLRELGFFKNTDIYLLFYDEREDYLSRTNTRSGHDYTEDDWLPEGRMGKIPPGWLSSMAHKRKYERVLKELENGDTITRVSHNAPTDWFIENLII